MKIMALCGSGLGSSFMLELNIKAVLDDLDLTDIEVDHSSIAQATPDMADYFIVGNDLANSLPNFQHVLTLNNLMDKNELKILLTKELK